MPENKAISAQDSALYVKAGSAPTTPNDPASYTEVDGLTGFPFGRGQANTLDATNLRSEQIENIAGLSGGQSVQVSGHRWPVGESDGQEILRDADPQEDLHFLMVLPTGDAATFTGRVSAFNVTPGVNQVLTFTADLLPRDFTVVTLPTTP
ncbi:phage tail protein [Pseudoxanthomonas winnipegensis]|uniref:Phage tail protein n=1 Tax=Pseudoxanthomonas winnipegensis TaxID=2480810 RepID=A0A4Q8L9W6_9GAMM|nr:phage tail protein [Pseudoxanthomonas winnipegensis]RZZ81398.1 phage tail protein [Pseudoxanthomonas winnipegensis]TAA25393.1 phage tail protein [Pseudoxanthomonas winnipegensis]